MKWAVKPATIDVVNNVNCSWFKESREKINANASNFLQKHISGEKWNNILA